MKIGYPQALLYYKYFPLWETFFSNLGAEVVLSGQTNKKILSLGALEAENELCLPVKVFYGHLLTLADKVDAIFVPRIVSVEKNAFTCPKFMGLPDMARSVEYAMPPIISPTIDVNQGWKQYMRTVLELGKEFTSSRVKILSAYREGVKALHAHKRRVLAGATSLDVIDKHEVKSGPTDIKIGIAGHPYNIYDKYISMNVIKRLRQMKIGVETGEMIPERVVERESSTLPKDLFWTYEREVIGTIFHWSRNDLVDGIIYILAFPCGPDSLIQSLMEHELRREEATVPMMSLVIDEHSAEAGFMTRIEAFTDMIRRKKRFNQREVG
ncbi:MAG TPA: hypothetical protein ENI11_04855 [Actinobacteria bacterium]|nr:hypothetical protein [Actinomycetota bacterium]